MYKTDYQGGPFVEIFTAQGKDPTHGWKVGPSGIKREYEKDVKGFLYCLEGSTTTTKMQLPKTNLVQRYLVFQLFVPRGKEFSFEIGIIDQRKNKRRLMFSSAQKEMHSTELHARIPLTILRRHMWLNLCIDLVSIVGETWRGQTFRCIESVCVSANCKLRRIFTMRSQPMDTAEDEEMYGCESSNTGEVEPIPKQCQFASDVQFITQLFNMAKVKHAERLRGGDNSVRSSTELDLNASGRRTSLIDSGYHIAFGTKVPGAPTSGRNKGNLTNRSNRGATSRAEDGGGGEFIDQDLSDSIFREGGGFDVFVGGGDKPSETKHRAVNHRRQLSDPATQHDLELANRKDYKRPDLLVQPHPPREPSTDRRRRPCIRVKNGSSSVSKDRGSSAGSLKDEGIGGTSSAASTSSQPGDTEDGRRLRLMSDTELIKKHNSDVARSPLKSSEEDHSLSSFESGISPSQSYKKEYNRKDYEGDGAEMDRSLDDLINILNPNHNNPGGHEFEEDEEESEEEPDDKIYMFLSKPKSAPHRHYSPSQLETEVEAQVNTEVHSWAQIKSPVTSKGKQRRGPKLENDFHSSDSSLEDEETQRRRRVPGSRPNSGSSSRPHSGSTASRPQSGTSSRPTSGSTSRPHSGTANRPKSGSSRSHNVPNKPTSPVSQDHSSGYSSSNTLVSKCNKNASKPPRKETIDLSAVHFPRSGDSPELRVSTQLPTHRSDRMNGSVSGGGSVSRMSRKSVKEIPKDDVRLSVIKSSEKPYDFTKYSAMNFKMEDITDSFEDGMFASMKRQTEEEYEDISATESPRKLVPPAHSGAISNKTTPPNPSPREVVNNHRNLYDFSPTLTLTSDEDSTWQAPPTEMKLGVSTDTLTSSNPRDWSGAFSPPIVFPGVQPTDSIEDLSSCSLSPRKNFPVQESKSPEQIYAAAVQDDGTDEDELDLLYDSCLNCYYDPKTQKYYELI